MDTVGAQYAMINALRTGNVILDMGLAIVAPAVVKQLFDSRAVQKIKQRLFSASLRSEPPGAVRTITCRTDRNCFVQDQHDNLLVRAIKLYLQHLNVALPGNAQVQLTTVSDASARSDPTTNQRLTWLAAENEWVDVGNGCSFRHFQQVSEAASKQQGDKPDKLTIFQLSSKEPDGAARVDAFITTALDWYRAETVRIKDNRRWLYTMVSNVSAKRRRPNDELPDFRYKRYQLTESKTFHNLFFPQKASLLRLLHDFVRKEGKYGVSGFPHKLGLLLHGPPGTGKTSMIKALAQHTGRSVVNVSLAQIETNQQLEEIMYDLSVDVDGRDVRGARRLGFEDLIFVLEDVDACTHVVRRRDGRAAESPAGCGPMGCPPPGRAQPLWAAQRARRRRGDTRPDASDDIQSPRGTRPRPAPPGTHRPLCAPGLLADGGRRCDARALLRRPPDR